MRARVIPTAEQFAGWVREATNHNDGPWVEAIQRVTGNQKGDAWCASFVTFVLDIAYRGQNPLRRTASCDQLLADARAKGWVVDAPQVGDVFLVMRSPTDAIHTGLVRGVGRQSVATIEGNSNDDGSREGWGVVKRPARKTAGLVFIRLPEGA